MNRLTDEKWLVGIFRNIVTGFSYFFVIGIVFFAFEGDWKYLIELDFYSKTATTTILALFLRWVWHKQGVDSARKDDEIKSLEESKTRRANQVSEQNRIDALRNKIEEHNDNNKAKAYKDKCDKKLMKYAPKKSRLKWREQRLRQKENFWIDQKNYINQWLDGDKEAININNIRWVSYYKVSLSELMSIENEYAPQHRRQRSNKKKQLTRSYGLNALTFGLYAFVYGVDIVTRDFTLQALFLMIVQALILTVNIYMGVRLGIAFVKGDYKNDLVEDTAFLQEFLNQTKKA